MFYQNFPHNKVLTAMIAGSFSYREYFWPGLVPWSMVLCLSGTAVVADDSKITFSSPDPSVINSSISPRVGFQVTTPPPSGTGTGTTTTTTPPPSGTGTGTTTTPPPSGTGTPPPSGTGTTTTPPPSGTGTPPPSGGTGTTTPPPSGTGTTGTPPPSGAGTTTPPPSGAGTTGTPPPSGTGTTTPPPSGIGTTGTPPPSGTGTTTPPPSGAGTTGTPPPSGAGTTTPPPSGAGTTGTPPPSGAGTTTPPPSGAGTTGTPPPSGTGTTGTPPPSGTGTAGTPPPSGTSTPPPSGGTGTTTPPPSGTGTGTTTTPPPSGTGTTPPPSGTGTTTTPPPSGTGTGTTTTPPPSGSGTPPPSGTGATTPPLSGTGTGTTTTPPSGTGTDTTTTPPPSGTGTTTSAPPSPSVPNTLPTPALGSAPITVAGPVSNNLNAQGKTFIEATKIESTGNVSEGVFAAPVENHGSISQSTFDTATQNHGLISNSSLTPNANLTGGLLTGTVTNQGTVTDLEFVGINLSGGTLAGTITNQSKVGGVIQDVQLAPQATLKGGKVGGTISAATDSVLQDVRLMADTNLTGGILTGNITGDPNHPAQLTNVEVAPGAKLSHVTLITPTKLPEGIVLGEDVKILEAPPLDSETLKQFEAGDLNTLPPETFKQLQPSEVDLIPTTAFAKVNGEQLSQLTAPTFNALEPAQIAEIPPTSFNQLNDKQLAGLEGKTLTRLNQNQFVQIPPPAFTAMRADQVRELTNDTLAVITPEQFAQLPTTALQGLTSEHLAGLNTAVVHDLTAEQLRALPTAEVNQMSDKSLGHLLMQLDPEKVTPTEVAAMLPADWQIDTSTGNITPPAETVLALTELSMPADSPAQVTMPILPDLNTSFGVGGISDTTTLADMNETLQQNQVDFVVSQTPYGMVQAEGTNDNEGVTYSFMCRTWETQQVSAETSTGVQMTEAGFIQITTSQEQQFVMVPAPKDPVDLSTVTNNQCMIVGKNGDVFLQPTSGLRSDDSGAREVVMFDALVEPAPEDICQEIDGETVCNFDQAPADEQPGLHDVTETSSRGKRTQPQRKKVVYSDGTSQLVYPTVRSPEVFIAEGLKLSGMEQIVFQADGTFKMTKEGKRYQVFHNFNPHSRLIADTEVVEPSLVLKNDNQLIYTVTVECPLATTRTDLVKGVRSSEEQGSAREVLEFDSSMESIPDETCQEVDGETVCEVNDSQ